MQFTVILSTTAEQHLMACWLSATDQPTVTEAAHSIDQKLKADPLGVGESRASSVNRIGFIPPLGFTFDVVVDDATVYVTALWLIK